MIKKVIIIALLIAAAAVLINYSLGGFKPVKPQLVSLHDTVIYGKLYEGSYNSELLSELIDQYRRELEKHQQAGQLTIVNYDQPDLEKRGMVKQFVGIIWRGQSARSDSDSLVLPACNAVQFKIPIKPLVMPSPEKLNEMARDYSIQMETTLLGYSIEQYLGKSLIINYPLN